MSADRYQIVADSEDGEIIVMVTCDSREIALGRIDRESDIATGQRLSNTRLRPMIDADETLYSLDPREVILCEQEVAEIIQTCAEAGCTLEEMGAYMTAYHSEVN